MADNKNPWEDDTPYERPQKEGTNPKVTKISDIKRKNNVFFEFEWKIRWLIFALAAIWLASGFYQIEPNEQGIVLRFGAYQNTTDAGLQYHLPYPIETVIKVNQTQERSFTLGVSSSNSYGSSNYSGNGFPAKNRYGSAQSSGSYDNFTESHMLTGDESIVDINLTIVWKIKNSKDYLFSLREPDQTVYVAAQSVLREIVGQSQMMEIITGDRGKVEEETKKELQSVLDEYGSGIEITRVQLQKADPPQQVVDAFNEVQRARNDKEKYQEQALAYYNNVVPKAEGQAIQMLNNAKAYKNKVVNDAIGESERYKSIYSAYKQGKDVTSTRMYFETMEEVLNKSNTVIVDPSAKGQNVLPLLQVK
ncbi:MAG: FtsH protease activity modulator HflK [Lactobacillaceae bacterium]|jgi:membrane protease subunit HflK|nr:FtsH protease activity modulator HflK [Lactobacillaceae bacterium]